MTIEKHKLDLNVIYIHILLSFRMEQYYMYFRRGEHAFQEKEYDSALSYFEWCTKHHPQIEQGYYNMAITYLMQGKIHTCIEIYVYMKKNDIGNQEEIDLKIQNTIGAYIVDNHRDKNVDITLVDYLDTISIQRIVIQTIYNHFSFAEKFIIYVYKKEPNKVKRHHDIIYTLIRQYCNDKNTNLFPLKEEFEKYENYYYLGLSFYFQGFFSHAKDYFYRQKSCQKKSIKHMNNMFYISSVLRSCSGTIEELYKMRALVENEKAVGNPHVTDYFQSSIEETFVTFDKTNGEQSMERCKKINQNECERMGMYIVCDFKRIPNKIDIQIIDEHHQLVYIKNAYIATWSSANKYIMVYDTKSIYLGKKGIYVHGIEDHISISSMKRHHISGRVWTFNASNQNNHYHMLCEIMNRVLLLKTHDTPSTITLLLSNSIPSYMKLFLSSLHFKDYIYYKGNDHYVCDEVVFVDIGLDDKRFYDCWSIYLPSTYSLKLIQDHFQNLCKKEHYDVEDVKQDTIIYISRDSNIRGIENEELFVDEVVDPLFNNSSSPYRFMTFDSAYLESIQGSLIEQMKLFHGAALVIAPHGAGLSNIVFCIKDTPIVEFVMKPNCNRCFEYIARRCDLQYIPLSTITSYYHGKYHCNAEQRKECYRALLEIKNKCCV